MLARFGRRAVDQEQRFYLEARGVPPTIAERLILLGFFEDLWARITVPGIRAHFSATVAGRLDGVTNGRRADGR